ncbi:hypothetical protein GN157_06605 [Flavobacterium rakeshii]|uniref:Uncharacterized protein n=1 Tax=Flavobacterium rakeshii TaxID=1038845 RepID=A0A6N8HEF6_9FLAO|nr:hypothetical protein [Flavobacterium rakeshii]MEE1897989.1 hypothetical protein [Flavobacterium rakeshii]MUV03377.1 hypothetical protein [Flavobacterium rakeshii]
MKTISVLSLLLLLVSCKKDNEMHLLRMDEDWFELLSRLFIDKPSVLNHFKSGFLGFENIYLAVRYYDEHSN